VDDEKWATNSCCLRASGDALKRIFLSSAITAAVSSVERQCGFKLWFCESVAVASPLWIVRSSRHKG